MTEPENYDFAQLRADIAKAAEQGLKYYSPTGAIRTGPSLTAWRQADPGQLAEHLAVLITAGIAPALDRHTHRVVQGTLKELQRPADRYMRLRDPGEDMSKFWRPDTAAHARAVEMLAPHAGNPHAAAAIPMVLPGKTYGVWTSGQEVITVHPAVFLGHAGQLDVGTKLPPWSVAREQASAVARAALGGQPGTIGYAVVYADGHWTVFEDFAEYPEPAGPVCPECGTDQWDFTEPGRALCDGGHQWDQAPAIPGSFARPGYPGDINDPERFPDDPPEHEGQEHYSPADLESDNFGS